MKRTLEVTTPSDLEIVMTRVFDAPRRHCNAEMPSSPNSWKSTPFLKKSLGRAERPLGPPRRARSNRRFRPGLELPARST